MNDTIFRSAVWLAMMCLPGYAGYNDSLEQRAYDFDTAKKVLEERA
ncbi:MAG: hypothetical protein ACLTMP_00090 [Eggerthella lenta]